MEKEITFQDLLADHDYYCSNSNYYSNDPYTEWDTFGDFYNIYKDADIDMNLIFRFDIHPRKNSKKHTMNIYMIGQRKGIFFPHYIRYVDEDDFSLIMEILKPHFEKMQNLWSPFSGVVLKQREPED